MKKTFFCIILITAIFFTSTLAFTQADGAPAVPTLTTDQAGADQDGHFKVTWNIWWGNNGTNWKLFEKKDGEPYNIVVDEPLTDNSPNVQTGTREFYNKEIGTYTYYVELSNSFGTTKSNEVIVTVSYTGTYPNSNIVLTDVPNDELQITVDLGVTRFAIKTIGASNPQYRLETNNISVLTAGISSTTLSLYGEKPGRGTLRIIEETTHEVRNIGIRVRRADGSVSKMPDHVAVGSVSEDTRGDLDFWHDFALDETNKQMDIRYIYLNGGPVNGWRTWGTVEGSRAINYIVNSRMLGMIPFFVYYNIPDTGEGYQIALSHMQDSAYMTAYYKDLKFLLDICNEYGGDETVGIIFEPDFIGYMMQYSGKQPSEISAQVSPIYSTGILGAGDPQFPNTLAGLVEAVNYMVKKYYPQAYYGWQLNLWARTGAPSNGVIRSTDTMGMTAGRDFIRTVADDTISYYMNANILSHGAGFVSIDKYGLDGAATGGSPSDPGSAIWFWNADHWNNYLIYCNVLHERSGLPVVLWQIPVGHVNSSQMANPYQGGLFPDLTNMATTYEDSAPSFFLGDTFKPGAGKRWDWFTTNEGGDPKITTAGSDTVTWGPHMEEARDAGINCILFGAGVANSTDGVGSPPTDDYWWITKSQYYFKDPVPIDPNIVTPTPTPTPTATPQYVNIAPGKPVYAKSEYSAAYAAPMAVDDSLNTAWASSLNDDMPWFYIDLGSVMRVDGLSIWWNDKYYATSYDIYISSDASNWTKVTTITNADGYPDTLYGSGDCRYIGILCTGKNDAAYSIEEFKVYQLQ